MRRSIMAAAGALLLAACGDSPSGGQTIQDGNWSGMTFDSTAVTFTVDGSSMENVSITLEYDMISRPDTTVAWVFSTGISDNAFQYSETAGETPWEFGLEMDGTFDPPDHVSGELTTWVVYTEGGSTETDTLEMVWSASPD